MTKILEQHKAALEAQLTGVDNELGKIEDTESRKSQLTKVKATLVTCISDLDAEIKILQPPAEVTDGAATEGSAAV